MSITDTWVHHADYDMPLPISQRMRELILAHAEKEAMFRWLAMDNDKPSNAMSWSMVL